MRKRPSKDLKGRSRAMLKAKAKRSPRYAKKLRSQGKMKRSGALVT